MAFLRFHLFFCLLTLLTFPAHGEQLKICVGDFPTYEIGNESAEKNPQKFSIVRTSILACMRRFKSGLFDVILSDSYVAISEFLQSPDYRILSLIDYSDGADVIMSIHDIPESGLRGTEWALENNCLSSLLLGLFMEKHQITLKDIKTTFVRAEHTTSALTSKRFFGIVTWPPHSLQARNRGGKILASTADFELKGFDMVVANREAIRTKGPLIAEYIQGRITASANMEQVYRYYAELNKISIAEAKENFQGLKIYKSADEVRKDKKRLVESIQASTRFYNQFTSNKAIDLNKLEAKIQGMIDFSLLPK